MTFYVNVSALEYDHGFWPADAVKIMADAAIRTVDPAAIIVYQPHHAGHTITGDNQLAVDASNHIFDEITTDGRFAGGSCRHMWCDWGN